MPENKGDPDNLLHFSVDPEGAIAAGAVIVALLFAVAMVFQWVPINGYTCGIVACSGAGAAIAKLVQARRRPNGSVTKHPRNHR
jgi:hypothetical protein